MSASKSAFLRVLGHGDAVRHVGHSVRVRRLGWLVIVLPLVWLISSFETKAQTLSLGGTVFRDTNNNGIYEPGLGELPMSGVSLELKVDNGDGVFGPEDSFAGGAGTDASGNYRFTGLAPGNYLVLINKHVFQTGGALNSMQTSTGNDPAPDPDDNVDGDDNGSNVSLFGEPFTGVASRAITLSLNGEPVNDGDSDANTNLTLDFGFMQIGSGVSPTIVTQPLAQTLVLGGSVTFSVVAEGTAPLRYQWRKGGANISGATNSNFMIGGVGAGDAGIYSVVVTNFPGGALGAGQSSGVGRQLGGYGDV